MRSSGQVAIAAAMLLALTLGGCGRRGGLEPPAAATPAVAGQAAQPAPPASPSGIFDASEDDQRVQAPQGAKRRIILDRLLD